MTAYPLIYDRCTSCGETYIVTPKKRKTDGDHECQPCADARHEYEAMSALADGAVDAARERGMLTGDIHQTDAWFREGEGRSR